MSTTMPRKKDKQSVRFHIRWMIERDMPSVLQIDSLSFGSRSWSDKEFTHNLKQRDTIGMIAELDEEVVAFMVYELHKNRLHVINFAVHPKYRRMGIGSAMVEKLISKLSWQRRNRIEFDVYDDKLDTHLFLKSIGFRAEKIDCCQETDQQFYTFVYRARKES